MESRINRGVSGESQALSRANGCAREAGLVIAGHMGHHGLRGGRDGDWLWLRGRLLGVEEIVGPDEGHEGTGRVVGEKVPDHDGKR